MTFSSSVEELGDFIPGAVNSGAETANLFFPASPHLSRMHFSLSTSQSIHSERIQCESIHFVVLPSVTT